MGFNLGKIVKPIGSLLNGITGVTDTADESYKASKKLMGMENANNIALWNMQNQYNTPAAQIARMQEAGIDVNPMTYAVGNGNMSTTASSVSTATPHMPVYSGAGNPVTTLMSVLNGLEDFRSRQLQNKILEKDVKTYEDTGIRPGSDGISQFARLLVNSPAVQAFTRWLERKLADKPHSDNGSWTSPSLSMDILNTPGTQMNLDGSVHYGKGSYFYK